MPSFLPIVNKARKPKFDLHLTIYDLNNVPLVNGTSQIKWHLPHSMHGEHRGRTHKSPIDSVNHRVSFDYSKVVPLRITIDKNNNLTECPIEFEVAQEFPASGGRDEKITLGVVKLNLSEYVEESENFPRKSLSSRVGSTLENARKDILGPALQARRRLSTSSGPPGPSLTSTNTGLSPSGIAEEQETADEGIIRRYLMQESKINSTLKLGILMVQVDGDRNYVAPPLKTAPMFGGIAGIMAGQDVESVDDGAGHANPPNTSSQNKSREASELQDMYRRALAASWCCQPGELPADECIEDIFSGGNGWKDSKHGSRKQTERHPSQERRGRHVEDFGSTSSGSESAHGGTLKPSDVRKMRDQFAHKRQNSETRSLKSMLNVKDARGQSRRPHRREPSRDDPFHDPGRTRSESIASLAPTLGSLGSGSGSGQEHAYHVRKKGHDEVNEFEVRDDLVSWALPGTAVS